jgi:hypothetical protein
MLNAFKNKRIHSRVKGNATEVIFNDFSIKENLRLVKAKFSEKYKRPIILMENKNNFKFGPKLYLSSKNPIKKNKEKKIKKITKLK